MPNLEKKFKFHMGADPEFVLTMQGRKIDAKQMMELILSKKTGLTHNPNKMGFDIEPFGNLGWDGANSTAEVRPKASCSPQELTNNIGGMFKTFIKHTKIFDMSVISEYSSVGGHIHFEIPKGERWSQEKKNTILRRLSSFYLPILIAENKTNLNLRLKQNYGSLKDYRVDEHFKYEDGSPGYTFEFRCPSAEWVTTPKLANATMAYMGVIFHEILNHPKNFAAFNDIIYKSDKQGDALQTLAIMEYSILTQSILNRAKKYVRKFEMYETFKEEIEYIFNPKQIIKDKQRTNYNIAVGWDLIKNAMPTKSEILASKKKIKSIAQVKDFDILKGVMNIHYNDDTNVALFAEAIKDRVAAYNWKLKNNYLLFGMRKGIEQIIAKNLKNDYLTGREIIKTNLDEQEMEKLFRKMCEKFNGLGGVNTKTTLDFATGKIKDMREQVIMIGIPYTMRIKDEQKDFLKFIYSLEKGEILQNKMKKLPALVDDRDVPITSKGEIYKILTKQSEKQDQIIFDSGSSSLRKSQQAMEEMIQEAANTLQQN